MAITRTSLLLFLLGALVSAQVSKKCLKADKAYPGFTLKRPAAPTSVGKCNMMAEESWSCCSVLTDHYMNIKAKTDFPTLALARVVGRLRKVESAQLNNNFTPVVVTQEFNDNVQREGEVTYDELTRTILKYYMNEECLSDPLTDSLVERNRDNVQQIADYLVAVYRGLSSLKRALEIASEYKVSDACVNSVMTNGIYTGTLFEKSMCQVCNRNYAILAPCYNSCLNVARGCLNEFTEVNKLLNELTMKLDNVHNYLVYEVFGEGGSLDRIDQDVTMFLGHYADYGTKCSKNMPSAFTASDSMAQPSNFSATPLDLQDLFTKSADHVCLLSRAIPQDSSCWNEKGIVDSDNTYVFKFDTQSQKINSKVRRSDAVSDEVMTIEDELRASTRSVQQIMDGRRVFTFETIEEIVEEEEEEEVVEPTEKEEEEVVVPTEKEEEEVVPTEKKEEEEEVAPTEKNMEEEEEKEEMPDTDMGEDTKEGEGDMPKEDEKKEDMDEDNNNTDGDEYEVDNNNTNQGNGEKEKEEELDTNVDEGASTAESSAITALFTLALMVPLIHL